MPANSRGTYHVFPPFLELLGVAGLLWLRSCCEVGYVCTAWCVEAFNNCLIDRHVWFIDCVASWDAASITSLRSGGSCVDEASILLDLGSGAASLRTLDSDSTTSGSADWEATSVSTVVDRLGSQRVAAARWLIDMSGRSVSLTMSHACAAGFVILPHECRGVFPWLLY